MKNGITSGLTANTFGPNVSCTRAHAVTFLWRAAGSPEPKTSDMPFTDVSAKAYYYKAVLWAVENGITSGTTAMTFGPDDVCTRAQIVTFLWKSNGQPAANRSANFSDVSQDAYYDSAVDWAASNGITAGTSQDHFSPDNECTRGQIVTFLYRDSQ